MIFDKEGATTVVLQENVSLRKFRENLEQAYSRLAKDHLILNLFSFGKLSGNDLLEFLELSDRHRGAGKSFVLVSTAVTYDDVPDELCLVPSIQEARDFIEMEEIERELDL